nr:hypothetical protein [Actinomycetales bacterium]
MILEEKERGRTILLSSHIMSEVEALADRVSIIRQGRVVQTGSLEDLRAQMHVTINATLERTPDSWATIPALDEAHLDPHGRLTATVAPDRVTEALTALMPYGLGGLTVSPPSLDDLFLHLYRESR